MPETLLLLKCRQSEWIVDRRIPTQIQQPAWQVWDNLDWLLHETVAHVRNSQQIGWLSTGTISLLTSVPQNPITRKTKYSRSDLILIVSVKLTIEGTLLSASDRYGIYTPENRFPMASFCIYTHWFKIQLCLRILFNARPVLVKMTCTAVILSWQ